MQNMNYAELLGPLSSLHPPTLRTTSTSLASTLQHFINSNSPSHGRTIHAHIIKSGFNPNTNVSIKLLILHIKSGSLPNARNLLDQMPSRTLSAYNYMMAGYFKAGRANESLEVFRELAVSGEQPDAFSLSMVLKVSGRERTREVHARVVKSEFATDEVLFTSLIDSYVKARMLGYARGVFDAMAERSLVSSTALIVGYMNERLFSDAEDIFRSIIYKDTVVFNAMIEGYSKTSETCMKSFDLYKEMHSLDFRPTVSSFVSIIGACCLLSALEFGEQIHGQSIKTNAFFNVMCGSALIDMYAKCGRIEDARRIFNCMVEKNVVSWTSMIDGYGRNGVPQAALRLFNQMTKELYVTPNHATFLSVLSACGHAGLVLSGKAIFESMKKDFGLEPRMEHYACMVDLLGRTGDLDEAYKFIRGIPENPDSDVWTALLGASRLHGNVEMADVAAREVFELSGKGRPGAYVTLSNTFAAAGKWEGVSEVRELMKGRRVSKGTGISWVGTDQGYLDSKVAANKIELVYLFEFFLIKILL